MCLNKDELLLTHSQKGRTKLENTARPNKHNILGKSILSDVTVLHLKLNIKINN